MLWFKFFFGLKVFKKFDFCFPLSQNMIIYKGK